MEEGTFRWGGAGLLGVQLSTLHPWGSGPCGRTPLGRLTCVSSPSPLHVSVLTRLLRQTRLRQGPSGSRWACAAVPMRGKFASRLT